VALIIDSSIFPQRSEGATLGKPKGRLFGGLQADRQRGCGGRAPAYYYFGPRNPGRNKQKKLRVENDRDSSSTKTKSPHTTPPRRGNLMLLEQCCWFFRKRQLCCWEILRSKNTVGKYEDRKRLLGNIKIGRCCCWEILRSPILGPRNLGNIKMPNIKIANFGTQALSPSTKHQALSAQAPSPYATKMEPSPSTKPSYAQAPCPLASTKFRSLSVVFVGPPRFQSR
jgi:hypothetical protein